MSGASRTRPSGRRPAHLPGTASAGGAGRRRRRRRGERRWCREAEFASYYGRPVIKRAGVGGARHRRLPVPRRAGRRVVAARRRRQLTGRPRAGPGRQGRRAGRDRPARSPRWSTTSAGRRGSCNMLRVFKLTSPMSVGSWLLAGYVPPPASPRPSRGHRAAAAARRGSRPRGAAVARPGRRTYTAVLLADTAVPAWHDGHRELPFVFVGSATARPPGSACCGAPRASRARPAGWPCSAPPLETGRGRADGAPAGHRAPRPTAPGRPGR